MEDWTASKDEPKEFSRDRVTDCDLCILLIARRRGFVPEGETKSITQLEYECAVEHEIDVLAFLLDDDALWHRKHDELDSDPEISAWRQELRSRHGIGTFDHEPTSVPIAAALTRWLKEHVEAPLPGTIAQVVPPRLRPWVARMRSHPVLGPLLEWLDRLVGWLQKAEARD